MESGQNDLAVTSHDLGAGTFIDFTATFAAVGSIATGIAAACALAISIGEPINIGESVDADEQPAGEARQEEQGARYEAEVALRRGPPDVSSGLARVGSSGADACFAAPRSRTSAITPAEAAAATADMVGMAAVACAAADG